MDPVARSAGFSIPAPFLGDGTITLPERRTAFGFRLEQMSFPTSANLLYALVSANAPDFNWYAWKWGYQMAAPDISKCLLTSVGTKLRKAVRDGLCIDLGCGRRSQIPAISLVNLLGCSGYLGVDIRSASVSGTLGNIPYEVRGADMLEAVRGIRSGSASLVKILYMEGIEGVDNCGYARKLGVELARVVRLGGQVVVDDTTRKKSPLADYLNGFVARRTIATLGGPTFYLIERQG